jgi:hypothetical protein
LLRHCLHEWPVCFAASAGVAVPEEPDISVVLPVSGTDRLPQFRAVLASLSSQEGIRFEIVVAEEGERSLLAGDLPPGVRYVFLERLPGAPYCKSRMLNAGVAAARGRHVVLHDADILVPVCYLAEVCRCLDGEWEAVRPIRFLFCLDESASSRVQAEGGFESVREVSDVMQNFPGGSVALRRDVFLDIGGMDERFRDWGGEDVEFLERLGTRNVFRGAWMPAVHVWHPPASKKFTGDRNNATAAARRAVDPLQRVAALRARQGLTHWSKETR